MNAELPKGWVWTSLGEIAFKLRSGGTPLKKMNEYYENGTIPFVKIEDISTSGKYLYNTLTTITEEGLNNSSAWVVPKDSLLYSMYASYGIPIINKIEVATNQAIIAFIPLKDIIELDYVYYYLLFVKSSLKSKIRGTTQENLNAKIVSNIEVPLPPLAEQQRIVNKIEELFTNLDKGVESLNAVKYKLKIYRQAILKYAMKGKLTEKWREENKDRIEPASVLLENINIEIELPYGWTSKYLKNIILEIKKINPKENPDNTFIYIDIASIDNKKQIITSPKTYLGKNAPSRARQLVKEDDILFSTVRTYLRNMAIVTKEYDNQVASTGFCVLRSSNINYKWLFYLVQTNFFLNPLTEIQRGTNYPAVRNSDILSQIVPLPPLEEQSIIVERIEQLFSLADYIEETVDSKLEQSKTLRQSILKKAFEGKLVPQDPNDEPAEILLEKIKKQRLNKEKIVQEKLI